MGILWHIGVYVIEAEGIEVAKGMAFGCCPFCIAKYRTKVLCFFIYILVKIWYNISNIYTLSRK